MSMIDINTTWDGSRRAVEIFSMDVPSIMNIDFK